MPSLIAFASGHNLPFCHLLDAFGKAMHAYHHLVNKECQKTGQTDRQTDGWIAASVFAPPTVGQGTIMCIRCGSLEL